MYTTIMHFMEVNFMKKIVVFLLVMTIVLSSFSFTAFAANEEIAGINANELIIPSTGFMSLNSDERFLVMLQGETINVFKQYQITPNNGWGLWINLTSLDNSFTVTVRNSGGTAVWSRTIPAGGQVKQKIVSSCNGNYYTVDFMGTGNFKAVGGIYQTEVI